MRLSLEKARVADAIAAIRFTFLPTRIASCSLGASLLGLSLEPRSPSSYQTSTTPARRCQTAELPGYSGQKQVEGDGTLTKTYVSMSILCDDLRRRFSGQSRTRSSAIQGETPNYRVREIREPPTSTVSCDLVCIAVQI